MARLYTQSSAYAPVAERGTSIQICFDPQPTETEGYITCGYVTFYRKQHPYSLPIEDVKAAVLAAIRQATDDKILRGFQWDGKTVILNEESKFNFLSVLTMLQLNPGVFPQTFKLNESEYHTFNSPEEYLQFIAAVQQHLSDTYAAGWAAEQDIDWPVYESAIAAIYQN